MEMDANRVPESVGWNAAVRVQVPLGATEVPHVFVSLKSDGLVPPREMLLMLSEVVPALVSITVWTVLVWPSRVVGIASLAAESFTCVPIPVRLIFCGLAPPSSLIETNADRVPATVGW